MDREKLKRILTGKAARTALFVALAVLLALLVWRVFFAKPAAAEYPATERETRLALLLSEVEGVESARVMIGEEDGVAVSAVIVFEGEDTLMTRYRVTEIAASLLSIGRDKVAAYHAA